MSGKSLNILIYCHRSTKAFVSISKLLREAIGSSRYTVYQLDESEPWQGHCALAVIASQPYDVPLHLAGQMRQYSRSGGRVLSVGGYFSSLLPLESFEEPPGPCLDEMCDHPQQLQIGQGLEKSFVLLPSSFCLEKENLSKVLHELDIDCAAAGTTESKSLYVYSHDSVILDAYFDFLTSKCQWASKGCLTNKFPGQTAPVEIIKKLQPYPDFYSCQQKFPEILIHSEAVTSTQDLLWNTSLLTQSCASVAILADTQLLGRGRGQNQWISPAGSLCLSAYFSVCSNSLLAKRLPFVQYIAALATVKTIDSVYQGCVDIKIKWPNDIYTETGTKIGGVLVNCATQGSKIVVCVGIGLNVNNSQPTTSLVSLTGENVSIKRFAGIICDNLNTEVNLFNERGHEQFIENFCSRWLHQDKKVRVNVGSVCCDAIIKSIDSDGYLSVQNIISKELLSVQPDGNSFDMMENLIAVKLKKMII